MSTRNTFVALALTAASLPGAAADAPVMCELQVSSGYRQSGGSGSGHFSASEPTIYTIQNGSPQENVTVPQVVVDDWAQTAPDTYGGNNSDVAFDWACWQEANGTAYMKGSVCVRGTSQCVHETGSSDIRPGSNYISGTKPTNAKYDLVFSCGCKDAPATTTTTTTTRAPIIPATDGSGAARVGTAAALTAALLALV